MSSRTYALGAVACVIAYFFISKLVAYIEAVRFSKAHGCKPVPKYPQSETVLGWELTQEVIKAKEDKRLLECDRQRHLKNGDTFKMTVMGVKVIATNDPENVKALLATNFKDFGLGYRLRSMGALFGSGIFTTDGAHWEHSRVRYQADYNASCTDDPRLLSDRALQGLKLLISIPLSLISSISSIKFPVMVHRLICSHFFFS
jgi:hypothetical protein